MDTLARGYRRWSVPLLMLMWDIGFKTGGGNTVESVFKALVFSPVFIIVAIWTIILGLAMDRRGKLMVNCLTDTSQKDVIGYIMKEHSLFSLLVAFTPLIYYGAKAMVIAGGVYDIGFILDIHGVFTLLATYDGIKAINGNRMIAEELK